MRRALPLAVLAATLAMTGEAAAEDCVWNASGNWSAAGTWTSCDGDGVPDSDDTVTLVSPHTVSVDASHTVVFIAMGTGSTLSFTANDPTVTASLQFGANGGTITGNGTVDSLAAFGKTSAATLTIANDADVVVNGSGSISDGAVSIDGGGTTNPSLQVNSPLVLGAGNTNAAPISGAGATLPALRIGASGSVVDQHPGSTTLAVTTENDGEIRAEAGVLAMQGGTLFAIGNGDFNATDGDTITLQGDYPLVGNSVADRAALEGAGAIRFVSGGSSVGDNADITVGTLGFDGGNFLISGSGSYSPGHLDASVANITSTRDLLSPTTLSAGFAVFGGNHTINPASITKTTSNAIQINSGADLIIDEPFTLADGSISINGTLEDATVQLSSTLTIPDTNTAPGISGANPSGNPTLRIGTGGTLIHQKAGSTPLTATYENDGEIRVDANPGPGTLTLHNGTANSTSNGDYRAEAGDTLGVESNTTLGNGAALEGPGTIALANGSMALGPGAEITASTLTVNDTLNISGTGAYAPETLTIPQGHVNSSRDGSATTLNAQSGSMNGDHTFEVIAFNKSTASTFSITDGADLVVDGLGTHTDGNVCLMESTPGVSGDPSLRVEGTYTLPAALTNAMTCNQGTDDVAHLIFGPGGRLRRAAPGSTQIHTRTLVAGGALLPPADESLGFSNELDMSSGAITVAPGGAIAADGMSVSGGTVTVGAGGELFSSTDPLTLTGGALKGTGEVKGDVVNNGGVIRPGASPGTLSVDGAFTQDATGTFELEVDGDQPGEFDVLAVSGLATLAGLVTLVGPGYEPENADVIQFLTSAGRSGTFDSLSGGAVSGGREWVIAYPSAAPFGARLVVQLPPLPTAGQPSITGTPASGQLLTCETGTWQGALDFAFEWLRDGQVIAGATNQQYTVTDADRGHALTCRVIGSNGGGSTQATSGAVSVPAPPADPPPADPAPAPAPPAPEPTPTPPAPPPTTPLPTTPAPTAQENRLAAAAPSAVAQALGFPRRACLSRRRFTIRLREPAGVRLASARITVAGKRVTARRVAGRMRATVDLRGLRAGRYTVRIVARTVSGKTLRGTRRYGTCTRRGPASRIPKL